MKTQILLLYLAIPGLTFSQKNPVGIFQDHLDIGSPKMSGSAQYDSVTQVYHLRGAGYNIWFGRDEFQYLYKKITSDFILTANFEFVGPGKEAHRKIGWMVRQTTDDNSPHWTAVLHGDGLTTLQWRPLKGSFMRDPEDQIFSPKKNYSILQLERKGKEIIMRAAHPGEPLQLIGSANFETKSDELLVGLFICSHNPDVVEEANIWNVRIDKPVRSDFDGYKDGFLGSRLEIVNIADGRRKIIHESTKRFEAPNWMPDGKKLLYNEAGSLFKIPIMGGSPEKLNTDFADHNNNDHGISFDGKMLAISHQRQGQTGNGSTVYVLPLGGGIPKLLTEKTPSYWHSWVPDGKSVIIVAQRDGKFDLFKVPIAGGPEVRLSNNTPTSHIDGPEYSPDGKYIYYNGSESGTMQIWRMRPDGSDKEQLTFDQSNSWFPHLSPDGKWIAFISFPETIDFNDHPFYKPVTLRLMSTSGGAPKVIAYLLGGQGSFNVPSWSPDSKYVAFVSNSEKY